MRAEVLYGDGKYRAERELECSEREEFSVKKDIYAVTNSVVKEI